MPCSRAPAEEITTTLFMEVSIVLPAHSPAACASLSTRRRGDEIVDTPTLPRARSQETGVRCSGAGHAHRPVSHADYTRRRGGQGFGGTWAVGQHGQHGESHRERLITRMQ